MRLFVNLQMFAENENETPEVTETSETTSTDEVEETSTEKEDGQDVEFTDEKVEPKTEKPTKTQSKEDNRKAYERRMQEKHQKELEQAKRSSYLDGVKKSTGGVNKYTEQPIVDDEDLAEYELMLEIDKNGDDPIADYNKYFKDKQREIKRLQQAEEERLEYEQKAINDDIASFNSAHQDVDLNDLLADDSDFAKKFGKMVGKVPLADLYDTYKLFNNEREERAKELALEKDARRQSSSGSITNGYKAKPSEDYLSMSHDEWVKYKQEHF